MSENFNLEQAMLIYSLLDSNKFKKIASYFNDFFRGKYAILKRIYEANSDVASGDLAKDIGVSTARIASALNTLEDDGMVERVKSDEDSRITIVNLTDTGRNYFLEQQDLFIRSVIYYLNKLNSNEIAVLKKVLKLITDEGGDA